MGDAWLFGEYCVTHKGLAARAMGIEDWCLYVDPASNDLVVSHAGYAWVGNPPTVPVPDDRDLEGAAVGFREAMKESAKILDRLAELIREFKP